MLLTEREKKGSLTVCEQTQEFEHFQVLSGVYMKQFSIHFWL